LYKEYILFFFIYIKKKIILILKKISKRFDFFKSTSIF